MWTPTTRRQHSRIVTRYQTDLTDAESRVIAPQLPKPSATGRPRLRPMREILNCIQLASRALPLGAANVSVGSKTEVPGFARHVRFTLRSRYLKPEVFNGLGHVPLAQWMSAVRSRYRLPPPVRAMRAYQTSDHLPVAVAQAFVLTRPTGGVDTSAQAICGLILASRRVWHCFSR
jgi:hypothetical protein